LPVCGCVCQILGRRFRVRRLNCEGGDNVSSKERLGPRESVPEL
jgi:hypothetical protein